MIKRIQQVKVQAKTLCRFWLKFLKSSLILWLLAALTFAATIAFAEVVPSENSDYLRFGPSDSPFEINSFTISAGQCTQGGTGGTCVEYVRAYFGGSYTTMPGLCQYSTLCEAFLAWTYWDLGYGKGATPANTSIMVLNKWNDTSGKYGHVAAVKSATLNADSTYTLSVDESNMDALNTNTMSCNVTYKFYPSTMQVKRGSGSTLFPVRGFIYGTAVNSLPDLTASATVAGSYQSGQTGVQIPVRVSRSGGQLVKGTYVHATLYWSTNNSWGSGDSVLWQSNDSKPDFPNSVLNSSGSNQVNATINIPSLSAGTYYIIAYADSDGWHPESDENNNWKAYAVSIPAPADTIKPTVNAFSVTPSTQPLGSAFTISYTVSDSGGSGLKQVELWRANDSGGSPTGWAAIKTNSHSSNGPVSSSFSDAPSAGLYWYGIHAVDNAGNWKQEPSPIKVTVFCTNTYYRDADGDGYGNPNNSTQACSAPAGYVSNSSDCNDSNAAIKPGATEVCDGVDNDCDGQIDENVKNTYYLDADGDGYGNPNNSTQACSAPSGYVSNSSDCNDSNAAIKPGAVEICDGVDNNCNGQVDDRVPKNTYYQDGDQDGYGNPNVSTQACTQPAGYVTNNSDCNDSNAAIKPGAVEICDGVDNNCNGQVDDRVPKNTYYQDGDQDGYGNPNASTQACTQPAGYVTNNSDCNDSNAAIKPGASEICDGVDNNCDGQVDEGVLKNTYYQDGDQDGYGNPNASTQACSAPAGYVSDNTDCNDEDTAIKPGATEVCDSVDNDCNGQVDDGAPKNTYYQDSDQDSYGNPNASTQACSVPAGYVSNNNDCNDTDRAINPNAAEICDETDNNCNWQIDEHTCIDDIYIEPNDICNNYTPCYATIQEGIIAAGDGATIMVAQGTYYENILITSSKSISGLLIQGGWSNDFSTRDEDPSQTIIDGSTTADTKVFSIDDEFGWNGDYIDVTIEGMTITNGNSGGVYVYTEENSKHDIPVKITLLNNIIANNNGIGVSLGSFSGGYGIQTNIAQTILSNNIISDNSGGGFGSHGGMKTLTNNTITRNSGFGVALDKGTLVNNKITGNDGYGVNADSFYCDCQLTFTNNTITDNRGIGVYAYSSKGGITLTLTNNTVTGNNGGGIYASTADMELYAGITTLNILNTIVWGNNATENAFDIYTNRNHSGVVTVNSSYSDIGNVAFDPNYPGDYNNLGNNINEDPYFVNPANGNYHLSSSSLLINQGNNSDPSLPAVDFEGDPRIINGAVDIGADEYVSIDSDKDAIPDGDGTNPCSGGNVANCDDNCPLTGNPDQADADNNGIGDACDCISTELPDSNCDGVDDDCNGIVDDGYVQTDTNCGKGVCTATGQMVCQNGQEINTCIIGQPTENTEITCNDNKDNDCNGFTDGIDTNCNTSVSDLTVTSVSDPPVSKKRGRSFNIKAKVKNKGVGAADKEFTIGYYLSKNKDKRINKEADILLTGDVLVSPLVAGASSTKKVQVTIGADTPPGKYYVKVCADNRDDLAETNEDNNCRASMGKIKVK